MAQSTKNVPQIYAEPPYTTWEDYPVKAGAHLYQGDALSKDAVTGNAHQLVPNEDFLGFSEKEVDNTGTGTPFGGASLGDGTEGSVLANTRTKGQIQLTVTIDGATLVGDATDKDKVVYASDGATFTYSNAGNNVPIGKILEFVSKTDNTHAVYLIMFESVAERSI